MNSTTILEYNSISSSPTDIINIHQIIDMPPNYKDFLSARRIKKSDTAPKTITNTRIDSIIDPKTDKIIHYAGNFEILKKDYNTFLNIYYDEIVTKNKEDTLTEIQLTDEKAPLLIDIDLQFEHEINERLYTKEDIEDILQLYMDVLKTIHQFSPDDLIEIFVMTKPNINHVEKRDEKYVKDGIHIIIGIQCHHDCQQYIRKKVIEMIKSDPPDFWKNHPTKNTLEAVFDEKVTKGDCPWQLYGSKKKNRPEYSKNEVYSLKYIYNWTYDMEDEEITQTEIPIKKYNLRENFHKLSARYENHPPFFSNDFYESEIIEFMNSKKKVQARPVSPLECDYNNKESIVQQDTTQSPPLFSSVFKPDYVLTLNGVDDLDKFIVEAFIDNPNIKENIKQIVEFTLILPETYWGRGSYELWIRVGWALYGVSDILFAIWVKMSSQYSGFAWTDIYDLFEKWNTFKKNGLSERSIAYWARKDAYEKYMEIKTKYNRGYVEEILEAFDSLSHEDYAEMVYKINRDKYICVLGPTKNIWYEFKNHRWCLSECASALQVFISGDMRMLFKTKTHQLTEKLRTLRSTDDEDDTENDSEILKKYLKKQIANLNKIVQKLGSAPEVRNIITLCANKFSDITFDDKLDADGDLLCFKNGVIDLKNKLFREGYPHDYISKCTNIDYVEYDKLTSDIIMEINNYMNCVFPEPELCRYMWEHLASSLSGKCITQTFHYYIGIGSNGKSLLTEILIPHCLGNYRSSPSISLVTEEMPSSGSANSQLADLRGIRYAVMQEPSKGKSLKEGIMKQISGGDNIKARCLYKEYITFMSQTSLCICGNNYLQINSQDEGTWRRIRVVPFMSLFTRTPDPKKKYQFPIIDGFDDRIKRSDFCEAFMSMLVNVFYRTNGKIADCEIVNKKSREYRNGEDLISQFIDDKINVSDEMTILKQTDIVQNFKMFKELNGDSRKYKNQEVFDAITNKYPDKVQYAGTNGKSAQWKNLYINFDE